jgi:pimeloyl-ACP methyl ester carboxylesterase
MAEHKVPIGDVTISCEVRGAGVPVVLVHGFPLDRAMWDAQISALALEFRVIAPDLRGFGRSPLGESSVATGPDGVGMDQHAADVVATLDALGVAEPVVLVGFSMGGYVAWQFALTHHQRLRGLVLCDTRAIADTEDAAANRLKMAKAVLEKGDASPALGMLDKLLSPETHEHRPEVVAAVKEMILRQSAAGIAAAQRGMARREDVRARLGEIRCPCLCLVGVADAISTPQEMREIAAALPDAKLEEIAGGHMTPMENAEAVTKAIREFALSRSGEA